MWHCIIECFMIFWKNATFISRVQGSGPLNPWRYRWHILSRRQESPSHAASRLRRPKSQFTPLWEPQISQRFCYSDSLLPEMTSSVVYPLTNRDFQKTGGEKIFNLKLIIVSWKKVTSVKKCTGAAESRYLRFIKHRSSISNRHWTESKNPVTPSITHICNMQY